MQKMKTSWIVAITFILSILISGCTGSNAPVQLQGTSSDSPLLMAEIVFHASLPNALPEGTNLGVEVLDEVTGLAFNPIRYQLQQIDPKSYFIRVTAPVGAVLKYRYLELGSIATPEYTSENTPIRYRLFLVTGPAIVQDAIAGWIDKPYSGTMGALSGQILSADNSAIPDIMVSIAGMTAFTDTDGKFSLGNIPTGTQNLVAYSLDGSYAVFQQGAIIADAAITPATFQLTKKPLVNVSFDVTVPDGDYSNVPIRIVGSLAQLGNSFADLDGGLSVVAAKGLTLAKIDNGHFQVTTKLPAGVYIEFKYTLGDGFWNAERQDDGLFKLRKVIVPAADTTYKDKVVSWSTKNFAPITFNVTDEVAIPDNEYLSVQLNPFSWTNPIPMWKTDATHWYFTLYSPLDLFGQTAFRYCKNDLCSDADAVVPSTSTFTPSSTSQTFHDTISK